MKKYPDHLCKIIETFKILPGVGTRTAERFAFHLLELPDHKIREMSSIISQTKEKILICKECGCLSEGSICALCQSNRSKLLCIVASPKDAIAIEKTHEYQGLYHVLGGLLSPIDGVGPESLSLEKLFERISKLDIQEAILALDSTVEGDATSLYITEQFRHRFPSVKATRLAFGLPMGSTLDYVDGGTLARALSGRSLI